MDEFVHNPKIVSHPGFSLLARQNTLVQDAIKRQGITLESLGGITSRQSFVGDLASALSTTGGVRKIT